MEYPGMESVGDQIKAIVEQAIEQEKRKFKEEIKRELLGSRLLGVIVGGIGGFTIQKYVTQAR